MNEDLSKTKPLVQPTDDDSLRERYIRHKDRVILRREPLEDLLRDVLSSLGCARSMAFGPVTPKQLHDAALTLARWGDLEEHPERLTKESVVQFLAPREL